LDVFPAGMTIETTTGLIQWTPNNDDVGAHEVTVRVQDELLASDTQDFTLTVINTNDAPTITSSPVTWATEDALYSYHVEATDPDFGDTLSFSLTTPPDGMIIDTGTGEITWTPDNDDVGGHSVLVRVQDGAGEFDTQAFTLTVANTNDAPTITSSSITTATQDQLYTYDVEAADDDTGDTPTFSLTVKPTGMTIDPVSGEIQWTPSNAQVGGNAVTVRVQDVAGAHDTQSFTVTVANVNDAPTITSTPVTSATEGEVYNYDVDATDPDTGDTLTFSLDTAPAGMTIDDSTGEIQWTPTSGQIGSNPVTVRVTDNGVPADFDTQDFAIEVSAAASGPNLSHGSIASVGSSWQTVSLGTSYTSAVIVATPRYNTGSGPGVVRIHSVTADSFKVRVDDVGSAAFSGGVHWVAVEEGEYDEAGYKLEAVKYDEAQTSRKNGWGIDTVGYQQS
jgi:hypothetical protein